MVRERSEAYAKVLLMGVRRPHTQIPDADPLLDVVPANAGTHTPRPQIWKAGSRLRSRKVRGYGSRVREDDARSGTPPRSRRAIARVLQRESHLKSEGAGNAGCSMHPRSHMQNKKAYERSHHGSPEKSGIPRAMVLTAYIVIFPVIGLCCHRHQRNCFRQLDASVEASEPHDFAVRFTCCSSAARPRPSHPAPR